MHTINTDEIKPLPYPTEQYKIRNAYKLGCEHARNHFNGEELDPDWAKGTTWATVPYTKCRPSVYYSFKSGFYEEWSRLISEEKR